MNANSNTTASGTTLLRRANSHAVLTALREHEGISRGDIAKLTGLSLPTVCRVVNDLLNGGIVTEIGAVVVNGARRKTALLDIDPNGGWVVALDIGGSRIRSAAIDLSGNLRESLDIPLENVQGEGSVVPAIRAALNGIMVAAKGLNGGPKAVGVSSSGIVDAETGVVKLSFNLQLRDFPMARVISEMSELPTVVRHDVYASTLAEAKLGRGRQCSEFAYITVGVGVGAGLVIGGHISELPTDAEFGLMVVSPDSAPDRFGGRGYLESISSGKSIAADARKELESGRKSLLNELSSDGPAFITAKDVAEAAGMGDELAQKVLARAARYLGIGIVNLAHVLGLNLFIVGGGVSMSGEAFWTPLRSAVEKYEYWPGRIRVEPRILGKNAAILGAGILALDKAMETLA
ncbi:MAG TPA: ROK family transcriptional regulator [Armatimonadota bacterium]